MSTKLKLRTTNEKLVGNLSNIAIEYFGKVDPNVIMDGDNYILTVFFENKEYSRSFLKVASHMAGLDIPNQ